jgi:hypothetical protein
MATKLIQHLETAFGQTVNSLTGKDFAVSLKGGTPVPPMEDAIVWQQAFSTVEGPSFWIAAGRDLWESLGRLTLVAAGLDEATEVRVEVEDMTDVGSTVPLLGGAGMRYDPLPEKLVSRRRHLRFAYHDGAQLIRLGFAEARELTAL